MFGHEDLDDEASKADILSVFMNAEFCIIMLIMEIKAPTMALQEWSYDELKMNAHFWKYYNLDCQASGIAYSEVFSYASELINLIYLLLFITITIHVSIT